MEFLDLMFQSDPVDAVAEALRGFPAEVVGLSVRNLDNKRHASPGGVRHRNDGGRPGGAAAFGRAPGPGRPAVGGHAGAAAPGHRGGAAVLGDGETAFPALLRAWNNGGGLSRVPRLAWLEDGHYRMSATDRSELVSAACTPYYPGWLDLRAYRLNLTSIPLQSKRGCPFPCIYCTYGISEGREYRLIPPEVLPPRCSVWRLWAAGTSNSWTMFLTPPMSTPWRCATAWPAPAPVRLQTLELNPAGVDDRLLTAMARAGFVGVGVTAESAADPVLTGLKKGYTAAQVDRAAAAIRRGPLPCFWMFMLGGPGETKDTVATTIRFAQRILRPGDVAYFNVGISIYPGTELAISPGGKGSGAVCRGSCGGRTSTSIRSWIIIGPWTKCAGPRPGT